MDRKELEIMAPAGNFECLRAAIQGGADSVYFGVGRLNMRSHSANNFAPCDLAEVVRQCREAGVRAYMTLNITIFQEDLQDMREALDAAKACKGKPTAILLSTVKGKGVSFMENNAGWHGKAPNEEQARQAVEELGGEW